MVVDEKQVWGSLVQVAANTAPPAGKPPLGSDQLAQAMREWQAGLAGDFQRQEGCLGAVAAPASKYMVIYGSFSVWQTETQAEQANAGLLANLPQHLPPDIALTVMLHRVRECTWSAPAAPDSGATGY